MNKMSYRVKRDLIRLLKLERFWTLIHIATDSYTLRFEKRGYENIILEMDVITDNKYIVNISTPKTKRCYYGYYRNWHFFGLIHNIYKVIQHLRDKDDYELQQELALHNAINYAASSIYGDHL